jgi:hypothetical protein
MCSSPLMAPWIGARVPQRRVLVLGESWYGPTPLLSTYIPAWCAGTQRDYLFSRIFNAANVTAGLHSSTATATEKRAFWDSVIFDNFVNWSIGGSRSSRPSTADFYSAATTLPTRVAALRPTAVWILGRAHRPHSLRCLHGIHTVSSPHPCSYGVTTATLAADWAKL